MECRGSCQRLQHEVGVHFMANQNQLHHHDSTRCVNRACDPSSDECSLRYVSCNQPFTSSYNLVCRHTRRKVGLQAPRIGRIIHITISRPCCRVTRRTMHRSPTHCMHERRIHSHVSSAQRNSIGQKKYADKSNASIGRMAHSLSYSLYQCSH